MSTTPLTKEKLAELVKCVLCMKTFTSPQTMKCLHTFCKHCLENHAKRSSVDDVQGLECPRCKQFTAQSDVTACTRTEKLLSLLEHVTKPKLCFECETESAAWKCQDCGDFYCEACKEMHCKIKKFKDHKFQATQDSQDDDVIRTDVVHCSKHTTEEVKVFCFDCETLVCFICLVDGHGNHKREIVHNAVDHVKSKVDERLAEVKQITNERFLRAEKLKDTRLMIQTYADESFDAIKSRYEFLKQKLEDDYESLTQELKISVDAELDKVNAAIVAEEAKQSHATAVTSYVENTLATTAGALNIQESIEELIPTMTLYCTENDVEPLMTSSYYRFTRTTSKEDDVNILGEIDMLPANFNSRYQPVIAKSKLESAIVAKTLDIELEEKAICYRMNIGFGKIVLCFDNTHIHIYDSEDLKCQELDFTGKIEAPVSAVLLNNGTTAVASGNGLHLVNLATSEVISSLSRTCHRDVFLFANRLYALSKSGFINIYKQQGENWKLESSIKLEGVDNLATMTVTATGINFLNTDNKLFQFNMAGELLQTSTLIAQNAGSKLWLLNTTDADGRVLFVNSGNLVLQHNDLSQSIKLDGRNIIFDLAFEDQHTFWILEVISVDVGRYKLHKYTI